MATKKPVAPGANPASDDLPAEKNALLGSFCETVWCEGDRLYRDLPWRRTRDPYAIWVSEVMLQQTQVARVDGRWQRWLERFPDTAVLADADAGDVLEEWQGLGYNRRALSLARAARMIEDAGGEFPREERDLVALPGIGPATAAGIRAFAFDLPGVYLETNVRAVLIHEFFPGTDKVADKELVPLVKLTCPPSGQDVRGWYYGLLDIGAHLKKTLPNPTRRARAYTRQSPFAGSRRQKRAGIVRILLSAHAQGEPLPEQEVYARLASEELGAGRPAPEVALVQDILADLAKEGFCTRDEQGLWNAR